MPARCPLCGAHNATCGARVGHGANAITIPMKKGNTMSSELKPYDVVHQDSGVVTTLLLNDDDAKVRGLTAKDVVEPKPEPDAQTKVASTPKDKALKPATPVSAADPLISAGTLATK